MVIKNCPLTQQDSKVLKRFKHNRTIALASHSGIDIEASTVYSICYGAVIDIEHDDSGYTVTVQYSGDVIVRYCKLDSVEQSLYESQAIKYRDVIGHVSNYVHFEIGYVTEIDNPWVLRVSRLMYHTIDPEPYLKYRDDMLPDYRGGED